MRMNLWLLIVVVLIPGSTAAQEKPNFSGTWSLVSPESVATTAADTMIVRQTFQRESVTGVPMDAPLITLAIERHFNSGIYSELYTIGTIRGAVGGSAGTGVGGQPPQTRVSTSWDDDKLVIEITYVGPPVGAYSAHKEVWSLVDQDTLSLAMTDRGSKEATTTTFSYRRQH